ncbi:MAG: pyridoxamine 5'-phosphate oxidase family protein [Thermodesulfovibrionales bacterium]
MRRKQKEITDRAAVLRLFETCHVGRLGTNGADGYPRVKPLNFAMHSGKVYFHTALAGEKVEDIRRDNRVCFEIDHPIGLVRAKNHPCEAEYRYQSVMIRGRAFFVDDPGEKLSALDSLMRKYQPEGGYGEYREDKLGITGVVRIEIEEMTGKQDLGKDGML